MAIVMDQLQLGGTASEFYDLGDESQWDLAFTSSGSFSSLLDEFLLPGGCPTEWAAAELPVPNVEGPPAVAAEANSGGAATGAGSAALSQAVRAISRRRKEFLAQVWAPTAKGELVLTTLDQPFCCEEENDDLLRYRKLSTGYVFPASQGSQAFPGLPGRVFTRLTPEWSPNVQYYDCREYLRVRDAASCNIKGTLAMPVMDPSSRDCIAVIELVANVEKVDYAEEISIICGALQAVNLTSPVDSACNLFLPEVPLRGREHVFAEIAEALVEICQAHKLPLAQAWLPLAQAWLPSELDEQGGRQASRRLVCHGAPYFLSDESLRGFRRACAEQSLERGQGVVGKAFSTNQPSFKDDIRKFSIDDYPLVHYARYFKLVASVGIRLRSLHTGRDDYVLEFFLPLDCVDERERQKILNGLSITMQCACGGLRTLTNKELREERKNGVTLVECENDGATLSCGKKKSSSSREEAEVDDSVTSKATSRKNKKPRQSECESFAAEAFWSDSSTKGTPTKSKLEKKRVTSEKTVALEVLQQHFSGSLKDAAKSIGVCPTTLKRICRQYGIARWPSRKINKVSRSLERLKTVIDSVEGIDRTVKLDALNGKLASTAMATANFTKKEQDDISTVCSSGSDTKVVLENRDGPAASRCCIPQQPFIVQASTSAAIPASTEMAPVVKLEPRVHGCSNALAALGNDLQIVLQDQLQRTSSLENFASRPILTTPSTSFQDLCGMLQQQQQHLYQQSTVTVKAKFGQDTARFKLPVGFSYNRLCGEVASKFKLEAETFTLKYLDDDAEWVMLNGDEDLGECLDVMRATGVPTVKLVVYELASNSLSSPSLSSVNL